MLGACAAVVAQGDAEAGRGKDLVATDVNRRGQRLQCALRHARGVGGGVDALQQERELIAAESRDGVLGPRATREAPGDGDQELIAGRVTEAVVDDAEVVEIEEHDRK